MIKIALAGNPNSGKTTLFNAITGKTEYVGNWPGVTVEKKEANLKREFKSYSLTGEGHGHGHGSQHDHGSQHGHGHVHGHHHGAGERKHQVRVVDLPGAYSLAPYTSEEAIARDFVTGESPDVLINIIDASSLERSLFFTTQLLELNIPLVIALNKQDLVKRKGNVIDTERLAALLQCSIVEVVANTGEGLKTLTAAAITSAGRKTQPAPEFAGRGSLTEDLDRQSYVRQLTDAVLKRGRNANELTVSDRVDRIVAHTVFGLPIFGLIMWAIYALSINGLGGWASGYLNDVLFAKIIPNAVNGFFERIGVHPLLQSLIVDGAIGGVGAVLGFLPLIMVLFFLLALLEDSGYMARVAVVMDRYFKRIGLSGKSMIPMIVGTGCSIPGIMASRTIEDENERKVTIILTPFVPCGAKLPIIALFSAVFFPGQTWVFPSMYVIAGALIIMGGLLLKNIFPFQSSSTFIIELPEYRLPSLKHALSQMYRQAKAFIIKASTIILVMNTLVWFMQTYSWSLHVVEDPSASVLATIGSIIAPLLIPLGFAGWQAAAATLTGFIAKENVVSTFAIVLSASDDALMSTASPLVNLFTPVAAFAYLIFNLFTPPCFAAIGAMNAEIGGRKWLARAIFFQLTVGYTLAMLITQLGTLILYGHLAAGAIPAAVIFISIIAVGIYLIRKNRNQSLPGGQ
ncbi:MAG: ferrous iron transporter B [Eubacteriales bacterium]|nr:ferrous iron transporter B [Eubacteriales bacterium]